MLAHTAVTVCVVQPGFGLVLFTPASMADAILDTMLVAVKPIQRIRLDTSDSSAQACIMNALNQAGIACAISYAPQPSAVIIRLQTAIHRAMHQQMFTATMLLTGSAGTLPANTSAVADAVVVSSANPATLIGSIVNGITHANIGVDTSDLCITIASSPGRWHAALAYAGGPRGAQLAAQAALKNLRQTIPSEFSAAYVSITHGTAPLGFGDFRAAHELVRSSCQPMANLCLTRSPNQLLGERVRLSLFANSNLINKTEDGII